MDFELELRFLAIFFATILLGQALLLLAWAAAKGVRRAVAGTRRAHARVAARASATTVQPIL